MYAIAIVIIAIIGNAHRKYVLIKAGSPDQIEVYSPIFLIKIAIAYEVVII